LVGTPTHLKRMNGSIFLLYSDDGTEEQQKVVPDRKREAKVLQNRVKRTKEESDNDELQ
jgi:hypothetical protein